MDPDWDTLVGVLVVRNQGHIVRQVLESSAPVIDRYHVIDNDSDDDTRATVEATADDLGLDVTIDRRTGYAGRLLLEAMQEYPGAYAFRLEGDQVYWPEQLRRLIEHATRDVNVAAHVFMLRNYCYLQNRDLPTNAPHPTIYPIDGSNRLVDGLQWPRSPDHHSVTPNLVFEGELRPAALIGVNCKVLSPVERIKRWHRPAWWAHRAEWAGTTVDEAFHLDALDHPYRDHLTLEEYIWTLRDRGKGSATAPWDDDFHTLADMGRALIEWDARHNCQFYGGPYPDTLREAIMESGYGLGVV